MDRIQDEPGLQDATVSDFLLPFLVGRLPFMGTAGAGAGKVAGAAEQVAAPVAEDAYGTAMREAMKRSMSQPAAPRGYAMGGIVMPEMGDIPVPGSSFDVGNQSGTYKTNGMIPTPPPMPAQAPQMPMAAPSLVSRGTMPSAPPMPIAPPPAMPGMEQILAEARGAGAQLNGSYTPEKRNALYMAMLQGRNSMPNAIGGALSSVGDAIAHGYGRDHSTNFLDKTLQSEKDMTKEGLDAFDTTQKGNLQQTAAGLDFQKMDPNSSISKISREAYAPLLAKLGYSPQALSKMSGANVESVAKVAAEYGGKEMENLFHQAQLIVEGQFKKAELGEKESARKMDALKIKSEHPIMGMLPTAANKALDAQAGLESVSGPAAMFAKNPQTGHRIMSTDGGKTWAEAK